MKLKKLAQLFFALFALAGACLFVTGCEKNDAEEAVKDAGDAVGDAVEDTGDAIKDATN